MGRNDNGGGVGGVGGEAEEGGAGLGYWTAVSALSAPIINSFICPSISLAVMGPVQLSTLSYRQDLVRQGKGSGWRHGEPGGGGRQIERKRR